MGPQTPTLTDNQSTYRSASQTDKPIDKGYSKKESPSVHLDIIAMVRSLQRTAGVMDCFRRGNADCDSIECDWRIYCLGSQNDKKDGSTPEK